MTQKTITTSVESISIVNIKYKNIILYISCITTHRKTWNDKSAFYSYHCSWIFRFSEQPICLADVFNNVTMLRLNISTGIA